MYQNLLSCNLLKILISISILVNFPSVSAKNAKYNNTLDNLFLNAAASKTVPGISAAIADKDGIVWAKGFGFADIENRVPMTTQHKMRIGSVAKLITVAGMMRLFEQGKLSLDTPINQYVPSWPKKHRPITLRQLASHSSGVRHYNSSTEFFLNQTFDSVISSLTLFRDDPLLFAPGTDSKYSTFAFSLIAAVMEGADQQRNFKQIIQQEVFTPLKMLDTEFDDQAQIIPFRQRPYTVKNGTLYNSPQSDHSYKYAGGGFVASPSDISRFAVAHSHPGFLTQKSLYMMLNKATLNNGKRLPYGISWMINFDNYKDREYYKDNAKVQAMMASFDNPVMHSGGSNGGLAMMILCTDHDRAVTVVKNVDSEYSADVFILALESLYLYHSKN
jgi:serine beta-lactamase-like protein LACTB